MARNWTALKISAHVTKDPERAEEADEVPGAEGEVDPVRAGELD